MNALISEANATNISAGGTTTNNNRSNSLKILDGMASSTLNPFGGTQASNLVGIKDIEAGGALPLGIGGLAGTFFNVAGQNGIGSANRVFEQYGPNIAGGAILLASADDKNNH